MPSVLFENQFAEPDWSAWESGIPGSDAVYSSRSGPYPTEGISDGPCATCMANPDNTGVHGDVHNASFMQCLIGAGCSIGNQLSGLPTTSTRMQYAIACDDLSYIPEADPNIAADGLLIMYTSKAAYYVTSGAGLPFQQIYVRRDGSIRMYMLGNGNPGLGAGFFQDVAFTPAGITNGRYHDSAPGVVPFDGTNHAYAWTLAFTGDNSLTYTVEFDETVVITGTIAPGSYYCSGKWGQFTTGGYNNQMATWTPPYTPPDPNLPPNNRTVGAVCPGGYAPQSGVSFPGFLVWRNPLCGPAHLLTRLSEVSITDGAIAYPRNLTVPPLSLTQCAAVITGMTADCGANTFTITGTGFPDNMFVSLQGPNAIDVEYDIISVSPTELVIGNLVPAIVNGGMYCVTGPCV